MVYDFAMIVVYPGTHRCALVNHIEAIPLTELATGGEALRLFRKQRRLP